MINSGTVSEIRVEGFAELNRALARADRDTRLGVRKALRKATRIVAIDAERHACAEISHLGIPWSKMRIGIATNFVYVAPRQRGIKQGSKKRPNLGNLLKVAMTEALEENVGGVEAAIDEVLGTVAAEFNA